MVISIRYTCIAYHRGVLNSRKQNGRPKAPVYVSSFRPGQAGLKLEGVADAYVKLVGVVASTANVIRSVSFVIDLAVVNLQLGALG